ncbi:MAG: DUF6036 family nucleotidyltransferase [Candidatus Asgardarchaeia archaeon]
MESSFERFVKRAILALNELKVDYVIVGGVAAIIYGRPRTTMDIDVIIDLSEIEEIKGIVAVFKKYDLDVREEEILISIKERSHFSIFDEKTPFRVDMKGVYTKLDEIVMRNRHKITLFGIETWVECPEDLIVAKLIYGSPQDIEDVLSVIINLKDNLNMGYLKKRAREEGIYDVLMRIIKKL